MSHYPVQRVCAIHDLSGFGRASLTLVIPILASLGVQVCPLPTAVLSSQTSGMSDFSFLDLSHEMRSFLDHWKKLKVSFDCIYSGFLGSPTQIELAEECLRSFLLPTGFAFVDPVLGDNGVLDPTQTPEMIAAQLKLVQKAHVIAPNLTEAAFLLNEPFRPDLPLSALKDQLRALAALGPHYVIITSAPASDEEHIAVFAYDKEQNRFWKVENRRFPVFYPGTGDSFSSVVVGALLSGESLPIAVTRAVEFVSYGIMITYGYAIPSTDGFFLEKALPRLSQHTLSLLYEEV